MRSCRHFGSFVLADIVWLSIVSRPLWRRRSASRLPFTHRYRFTEMRLQVPFEKAPFIFLNGVEQILPIFLRTVLAAHDSPSLFFGFVERSAAHRGTFPYPLLSYRGVGIMRRSLSGC